MVHGKWMIAYALRDELRVVSGGWSGGNAHYVDVLAISPVQNGLVFQKHLLRLSSTEKKIFINTAEHFDYMNYVLITHGKSFMNAAAIVCDNKLTNKTLVHWGSSYFVAWNCHRYNPATKAILSRYCEVLTKVQDLSKKLICQNHTPKFRRLTHLTVQAANETHWSSTCAIIHR